jgi:choline transport protein
MKGGEVRGTFAPMDHASGPISRDDAALARLGKKPVLKRHFGFMTILGFSCTILITWEGSLVFVSLCQDWIISFLHFFFLFL